MKKYFYVFRITLQKALSHRGRNLVWIILGSISPLMMIAIWSKYYATGGVVKGYTLGQLAGYYLIAMVVSMWLSAVSENVEPDIKDGELSNYVIKPFDYMFFRLFWEVSWYSLKFATYAAPAFVMLWLFSRDTVLNFLASGPMNILLTFTSLVLSYLISFGVSLAVGYLGFFTSTTNGFKHFFAMINEIFTGRLIPIVLFPLGLQKVLEFLPFKYMVYFPIQYILGKGNLQGVGIQVIWVVGLFLLCRIMWRRGIKKFSAFGL